MPTDIAHDLENPVDDRYSPPPCGELDEIRAVLDDGRLSGGAQILPVYERTLAHRFGAARAIAVNSGTSVLHAALIAFDVRPGTEVLVPATAPLPTAMPILTCGATPVPVDTLPNSLALDPTDVDRKLTARTRAAITLPLWGYPNDERAITGLLADAGVPTIEDAAQAHGTRIANQHAGTLGRVGCFSTHDRKLLSTGEGGFILTNDQELADRIDYYTHLGHLRGGHGVNYKLAGPLAAIGLRRLTHLDAQLTQRRRNAERILAPSRREGRCANCPTAYRTSPTTTTSSSSRRPVSPRSPPRSTPRGSPRTRSGGAISPSTTSRCFSHTPRPVPTPSTSPRPPFNCPFTLNSQRNR